MLIFRHHTVVEIIDLDDHNGLWVPVEKNKENPIMVGLMPMAMRANYEVRGSFTIENEKRYCFYWNDQHELIFRTSNQRICLLRGEADGGLIDLMPGLIVDLQPATYGDGRAMPNMSVFTMSDSGSGLQIEVLYDSERYLQYYLGNFTHVPDEDLSHWDFFVHVKRTLEELKMLARARTVAPIPDSGKMMMSEAPVTIQTGQSAPRSGVWVAVHHLDRRCWLEEGEVVPDVDGRSETWVWVAN